MKLCTAIAVCASLLMSSMAAAAEVTLLASGATREACMEEIASFEKSTGNKVKPTWAGNVDIKKRIAAGEVYDVVIASGPSIDAFIKQGKIVSESRTDVMKSAVGAAVRAGASKPDIGSSDSLKQTLLTAKSIGYSTGPSGEHIINLVERMGIAEQVKPKLKQVPSGARIGTLIASGEVEIGFQQVSELIHDPSIDYLGPLPEEIGMITVFTGEIHSTAREPEQGKALMKHLTAPAAAASIKAHGMEPG